MTGGCQAKNIVAKPRLANANKDMLVLVKTLSSILHLTGLGTFCL